MAEQGHAKNLENLKKARDFATSWGVRYAPTNPVLALANINSVIAAGEAVADELQAARTPYRTATAAAEDAFAPLSKLVTRVMNSLRISGVPESVVEDAETYARKIQGRRKEAAPKDDPSTPDVNEGQNSHSASQMSRTQRIENTDALISLLQSNETFYKPNENELKVSTLGDVSADLAAKTTAVQTTFVPYSNKLGERDDIYYTEGTGIVAIGKLFKLYVKAAFGTDSPEYAQIKDLEFKSYERV
jgi:hypothetical protein